MLINAEKHLDIFKKICRNFQMFCTKNLAILLSFLKEFTESKKREKNVFPIIQGKTKNKPARTTTFLVSVRQAIICISRIIFQEYFSNVAVRKS